jgi:hypothetical protein
LGLAAFVAVVPLIEWLNYGSQKAADHFFGPDKVAGVPVPLFFFALVLGTLYYRTRRVAPSIIVHAALNAATLAVRCWGMG